MTDLRTRLRAIVEKHAPDDHALLVAMLGLDEPPVEYLTKHPDQLGSAGITNTAGGTWRA